MYFGIQTVENFKHFIMQQSQSLAAFMDVCSSNSDNCSLLLLSDVTLTPWQHIEIEGVTRKDIVPAVMELHDKNLRKGCEICLGEEFHEHYAIICNRAFFHSVVCFLCF